MKPSAKFKIQVVLENLENKPEMIKAFKEDNTLEVLYKNGINLYPTEALALSDIINGTNTTYISNDIDDLRQLWKKISEK